MIENTAIIPTDFAPQAGRDPRGPELLAPAGDWEAMRAAVANGADAVYFGLSAFNARHRAANFSLEELPEVMQYLHGHNVRGYVTLNVLIFTDEFPAVVKFINAIAAAGADAVIVQDLGVAALIRRLCPTLSVHGSTQMTLTEPLGIEFVRKLGVDRVILARELSIADIREISTNTAMPLEVFVHGALCISYSGQCLTSEALGGRSANRGQCAQACRLPYELIVDGQRRDMGDRAYLLSPQDLASYDLVDDLADTGVVSLKIEGRLKSPQYVAAATQTYRAALDAAAAKQEFAPSAQQETDLAQSFSRGFTHGFFDGVNHQTLVHARFPKSRGVRVGKVCGKQRGEIQISLEARATLKAGDGIVFDEGHPEQDEQGGRIDSVLPLRNQKNLVSITLHRGNANLGAIAEGTTVWKTDDPEVRRRLEYSYSRDRLARREKMRVEVLAQPGNPLTIRLIDERGNRSEARTDSPLQLADRMPMTREIFAKQMARLGSTPFELGEIRINGGADEFPPVMIPFSVLNDLRHRAVEELLGKRRQRETHEIVEPNALEAMQAEAASIAPRRGVAFGISPSPGTPGEGWGEGLRLDRTALENRSKPSPYPSPGVPGEGTREKSERGDCPAAALGLVPTLPQLYILARSMEQLEAAVNWRPIPGMDRPMVYCELEDVRRYPVAVKLARSAGVAIGLATVRIIKPSEQGLLKQVASAEPDAILVRNLAGLSYFGAHHPAIPLIADYSLNVANELTAAILARQNLARMVPSYDLTWKQLAAMLGKFQPGWFEVVIHQHMPMFHIELCVFAHTLSDGKDFRDCGRPCEKHRVDLRDRQNVGHALVADVGCRNTVYNGTAQSAAEYFPRMSALGIRHFRIELLRQNAKDAIALVGKYARVLAGIDDGRAAWRQLNVIGQLGVTRGTME